MEDSEVKTAIADIQEQSVAPVTKPAESGATPITETAPAEQPETKGETEKGASGVPSGVQKRIDQVTAKFYAALDEKKQLEKRVKELEETARPQTQTKEVSMFEDSEDDAELVNLQKTVAQVRQELDAAKQAKRFSEFSEFVSEMREKYDSVTDEETIKIVEELNRDDVPPEAHGAIEKYFAAYERNVLATKLQEKETKQERKAAVTETKTVVASDRLPDDDNERLHLLVTDPAKYEELAKKSGLRG